MSAPTFVSTSARVSQTAEHVLVWPRTARGLGAATATLVTAVVLLLPIGAVLQVVLTGQLDDRSRTQAIVVLDPAHYWGDPKPVVQARADHAAELYRAGIAPVIVVAGPARTEAVARAALLHAGIPAEDVIDFPTGSDTVGSLEVVAGVMRDLGWSAATLVTDPAHAARAQATAAALGIDAHVSPTEQGAGTALTSEYVGRETVALLRYYVMTRWSLPQIIRAN